MADILYCINGSVDFRDRTWEHPINVPYPFENQDLLQDIELSLYGHLNPSGAEANNVRVYWDDRDISDAVLHQLQASIDQSDQNVLTKRLKLVLSRFVPKQGELSFPQNFNQLTSVRPLSKQLTVLGNGTDDSLFNYLYRDLPIAPISLDAVLRQGVPSLPAAWNKRLPALLTFSSGPCRFYSDGWKPNDHPAVGGITYRLNFTAALTDALTRIEEKVGGGQGGTIQALISKVRTQLDNLSARVEKCDTTMGDAATLQAIRQDLDQIKSNLNIS